jgi:hypothetical protein
MALGGIHSLLWISLAESAQPTPDRSILDKGGHRRDKNDDEESVSRGGTGDKSRL